MALMRTSVKFCRCPCSFLYCFLRFRWKTRILSPRPSPSTSAITLAVDGLSMLPGSPLTASTSLNSPVWSFDSTLSIFNTSPGATRYCLPPVRITAYINPPAQVRLGRCAPIENSSGGNFRAACGRSSPAILERTSVLTATGRNRQTSVVYRFYGAKVNLHRKWCRFCADSSAQIKAAIGLNSGYGVQGSVEPRSGPYWNDVEQNGEVVGHAAGQHEQMPKGMKVVQPVQGKKDDAQRVSHASGTHPHQAGPAEGGEQRPDVGGRA